MSVKFRPLVAAALVITAACASKQNTPESERQIEPYNGGSPLICQGGPACGVVVAAIATVTLLTNPRNSAESSKLKNKIQLKCRYEPDAEVMSMPCGNTLVRIEDSVTREPTFLRFQGEDILIPGLITDRSYDLEILHGSKRSKVLKGFIPGRSYQVLFNRE